MPIKVIDTIKPNGIPLGSSQFPTVEDIDILGGYQVVGTDVARNNIPAVNRKQGMLVYVVADQLFYQLGSDLVTWSVANFASDTTLAGDVTGQGSANTVAKVHGATVPTAGSLTTGNTLQVSGASALSYGPLNLAGGSNYVTGQLPTSNLANLSGDTTGPAGSNTVTKIQGVSVSTNSVAHDGYALVSTSGQYVPTGVARVFNVKNYGALGNSNVSGGGNDDTIAIQAAIDAAHAAGGGMVFIPAGYYKITSSLHIYSGTYIQGETPHYLGAGNGGQFGSVISYTPHTGVALSIVASPTSPSGTYINRFVINDILITGNQWRVGSTATGIQISGSNFGAQAVHEGEFNRVFVVEFAQCVT